MNKPERFANLLVILILLASVAFALSALATGRRGIAYALLGMVAICFRWLIAKQKPSLWFLTPGLFLVLFYFWRSQLLSHTNPEGMRQATYDLYALFVDGSFGAQPSVWITHFVESKILRSGLQAIYEGLPFAMGVAYASFLEKRDQALKVFACFCLAGVLGVLCYRLLPICGPAYLPFGDDCFYYGGSCATTAFFSGTPAFIDIDPQWPRNGMPSLHMGWALLIWWSCRDKKYGQWIAFVFVFFTAISTMVYGEHYLVDLLAAFFFSLIPWSVCLGGESIQDPRRALVFATGASGYLTWVALIRYKADIFWISPLIPWTALLISCVCPLAIVFLYRSRQARHPVNA